MNSRKTAVATKPQPVARTATSTTGATVGATPVFGKGAKDRPKFSLRPREGAAQVKRTPVERRFHQTIRRVDLWSVLKVSICFYLCALVVMLTAGIILWYSADTLGLIHNFEKFVGELANDKGFKFLPGEILRAATLLGLVFVCIATVMGVLATAFYNLFADLIGGIEITVSEEG